MHLRFINPPLHTPREERLARAQAALAILDQAVAAGPDNRWVVWVEMHHRMMQALNPDAMLEFQRHPELGPQITGGSGRHFLEWLGKDCGAQALNLMLDNFVETTCGQPKDLVQERGVYITVTSMRHLYHLAKVAQRLPLCFKEAPDVVEIGGGYGNLARLALQSGQCRRYFIVDHPVLLAIQYFFISEFVPPRDIAVLVGEEGYLKGDESCPVQLVSSFAAEALPGRLTDPYALVSTMALTEIPRPGQEQYLGLLDPHLIYVFGQLENRTVGGGRSAEAEEFSNQELVFTLGQRFHTLEYRFHGYHFEYIGRRF